jgi:hypothetical protein
MISLSTGGILKWVACRKIDRTEGPNDYQNSSLSSDSLKIFRVIASGPRCESPPNWPERVGQDYHVSVRPRLPHEPPQAAQLR